MQPVVEQVEKGDIPKALNYCSDIAESLVGEVGNREAIWVNGEKSVIIIKRINIILFKIFFIFLPF